MERGWEKCKLKDKDDTEPERITEPEKNFVTSKFFSLVILLVILH